MSSKILPKIHDLYANKELASKQSELNTLLNSKPNPAWIKIHEGINYIPIGIIEYLLTAIYLKWWVEIKNIQVVANSIVTTIRLHYQDPITEVWAHTDGVGAAPIQTKKGASATDFTEVLTYSVQKAAPSSESFAIKDAAEKLGNIFGKDINRQHVLDYSPLDASFDSQEIQATSENYAELFNLLKNSDMDFEDAEFIREKLNGFINLVEYRSLKLELIKRQRLSNRDRVRNGEVLNMKQLGEAVKESV